MQIGNWDWKRKLITNLILDPKSELISPLQIWHQYLNLAPNYICMCIFSETGKNLHELFSTIVKTNFNEVTYKFVLKYEFFRQQFSFLTFSVKTFLFPQVLTIFPMKSIPLKKKKFFFLARTGEFMMIRRCALEDMNSQCGRFKFEVINQLIQFYSFQFYSILFYSILFYSILFYSILFNSILFYSILYL